MGGHLLLVTGKVGYAVRDGAWLWPQDLCVCVCISRCACVHMGIFTQACVCVYVALGAKLRGFIRLVSWVFGHS